MFEGIFTAVISFFVLAMVSAGSMDYIERNIKDDCEKIGYFRNGNTVYKCEQKK